MTEYNCTVCNYKSKRRNDYSKHLLTNKHLTNVKKSKSNSNSKSKIKISNDINLTKSKNTNKCNLVKDLITNSNSNTQELINNGINKICGYLYLLHYNNCNHNNVFKIGKTINLKQRFNNYNKDYTVIYYFYSSNCHHIETEILKRFKSKFKQCKEFGNEYFKGDCKEMMDIYYEISHNDIFKLVDNYIKDNVSNNSNIINDDCIKCEYCNKKFALLRTLHKHHLKSCIKIPDEFRNRLIIKHNKNPRTKIKLVI
jgi:hypothetical protein